MIITVTASDTIELISAQYAVPTSKIISDNGIIGTTLVTGQSLIIDIPESRYIPVQNTTVEEISQEFNIESKRLFRNNYFLLGKSSVPIGSYIVLSYVNKPQTQKIIGGYAYDFITTGLLSAVINYLTYIMPFTYGFTAEGELIAPRDEYILNEAKRSDTKTLMHISTLTEEGLFDSNLPGIIFASSEARQSLLDNITENVLLKGYDGVDIDFEFLPKSQKENYIAFTKELSEKLHSVEKILVIAVPPKTSDEQDGLLVEGIDYQELGKNADYILSMTYEYGYKFGPPLAVAPINQITKVIEYAVTRIPSEKILLGISNYGYDWTLPYVRGLSDAPSLSTVEAIELAKSYGSEIMFDEVSKAPFFFYTDNDGNTHEVWFEDARSFAAKMDLIKEYNLAGGFIWDLMRENPQGYVTINSLVEID